MTLQLDIFSLPQGRKLRNKGIRKVLEVENERTRWVEAYQKVVQRWFDRLPIGSTFTGEALRIEAERLVGEPHHPNCWGANSRAVLVWWSKEGRIVESGRLNATRVSSHACSMPAYRKVR